MKNYGSEWKRRVKAGEFVHGGHIFLPNAQMAEAMACYGYEYLWIDGEHGSYDRDDYYNHITAVNGAGCGAFIRVTANDPAIIKPVLEMGPDGIIVPMISTAEETAAFVSACTYPPKGTRGFGPRRGSRYGAIGNDEYLKSIDDCLVKIVQIEHVTGVANIDKICEVPGLDAVTVGPFDLSASMGLLGQLMHPDMQAACKRIVDSCKAHGIPIGPSIGINPEYVKFWMDLKPDYIFCGEDLGFIKAGTESNIKMIKELRK